MDVQFSTPASHCFEETKEVVKVAGREWVQLDTEEVAREDRYLEPNEPKTRLKPVMGYSPEIRKAVTVTQQVYCQTIASLDMAAVITAINEL